MNASNPKPIFMNNEKSSDLFACDWANESRIICKAHIIVEDTGMLLGFTRVFAVNDDGSDLDTLTKSISHRSVGINQNGGTVLALDIEGKPDRILMTREWIKENSNGTLIANEKTGLGVEEVDIRTQRSRTVETPIDGAVGYLADETGRVRIMLRRPLDGRSQMVETIHSFYRSNDSDDWKPLAVSDTSNQDASGFFPVAVDSKRNVVFGFDKNGAYDALYTVALDGSGKQELVLSRDDVDVDGLMRIGRKSRVVGASYATEARHSVYFDPSLKGLADGLAEALPERPMISFVDSSEDENKLLIVASSGSEPGMSYLFDKTKNELSALIPMRPELSGKSLAEMKPIEFTASDGTVVPGYLTLPPGSTSGKGLPAIVMPHGGPGSRDELGFDWLVQFFAAQGYAVLQPNFRGSAGYGSEWFGQNGFKAWPTAIGDINDAGKWLVSEGIADADKLVIVGWSYGGYAALQSQVVDPELYKAVIAIAPVTDLDLLKRESFYYTNYGITSQFIGEGEHIRSGSPAKHPEKFSAPVLLFHGTIDQNVGVEQSRLLEKELKAAGKQVEYHEFEGLAHGLGSSDARAQMLASSAAFLSRTLGR